VLSWTVQQSNFRKAASRLGPGRSHQGKLAASQSTDPRLRDSPSLSQKIFRNSFALFSLNNYDNALSYFSKSKRWDSSKMWLGHWPSRYRRGEWGLWSLLVRVHFWSWPWFSMSWVNCCWRIRTSLQSYSTGFLLLEVLSFMAWTHTNSSSIAEPRSV